MFSKRAVVARCAAAAGVSQSEFRKARWPLCPSCSHPMAQETEPKHVKLEPDSKAPWFWVYLLRCTKCAGLQNYAENSSTGVPHAGVFGLGEEATDE